MMMPPKIDSIDVLAQHRFLPQIGFGFFRNKLAQPVVKGTAWSRRPRRSQSLAQQGAELVVHPGQQVGLATLGHDRQHLAKRQMALGEDVLHQRPTRSGVKSGFESAMVRSSRSA